MSTVREIALSDLQQVSALTETAGWGSTSLEGWERLWHHNPAVSTGKFSRGWVLEESGRIVGYLCNVARLYRFGGSALRAASASSLVVMPEFRGLSLQLFLQYARQPEVDLLLNTTAAPNVSRICEFLKFKKIPQRDYDVSLYWVLRPREFVAAALKKKHVRAPWASLASSALAAPAWVYFRAHHHLSPPPTRGLVISVMRPDEIGSAFDELWSRSASEPARLLAYRNSDALRWHFVRGSDRRWPFLVSAFAGDRLVGYAAVVRQDARHLGLSRARFGDVFVGNDDPAAVQALLREAILEAGRRGAGMIELVGFPDTVRMAARALNPLELRSDSWPFLYRARDEALQRSLAGEDVWYASLFDGDGSL